MENLPRLKRSNKEMYCRSVKANILEGKDTYRNKRNSSRAHYL